MKRIQRLLAVVLSASILNISAIHSAQAALVPTEEAARLATVSQTESGHVRLTAALARDDVRAEMLRQGVDPTLAQERIAALTDDEATRLADQIDSAPAGGIIGAILLVFFVLLITDILGLTKVFPSPGRFAEGAWPSASTQRSRQRTGMSPSPRRDRTCPCWPCSCWC